MKISIFILTLLFSLPKSDYYLKKVFGSNQETVVSGNISDVDGKPFSFLKIKCVPKKDFFYTDKYGNFSFKTQLGNQLIVKNKNLITQKITIGQDQNLKIILIKKRAKSRDVFLRFY